MTELIIKKKKMKRQIFAMTVTLAMIAVNISNAWRVNR